MSALFRLRDLAIKALVRSQWASLRSNSPRLAVVPHEHVGLAVLTNGLYEREELACLTRMIATEGLGSGACLDIGANVGNHAVVWARHFEQVVCFEPNPYMGAVLRANLTLNNCRNVEVCDVGLGLADGELPFSFHEAGNDGTGTFAIGSGDHTLPVRQGDALVEQLDTLKDRAISFIKCDVEGFEDTVFRGLQKTLAQHRPVVVFESNSADLGARAWEVLRGCGYEHLHELRHNASDASPLLREMTRLFQGHRCEIVAINRPPAAAANLIAAPRRLA